MRLALTAPFLLLALPACKSALADVEAWGADSVKHNDKYTEIRFEHGQEAYDMQASGGGLRLSISRIRNDYDKRKVVVTFELRNNFDQEVRFDLSDVRLSYSGEEYAAKSADLFRMDPHPNVLPKSMKKGAWAFELGTEAASGEYDVHILGLQLFTAGSATPVGQDFVFKVKVPGKRGPMIAR